MIEAIVGLPGSGKTLWAVKCLVDAKRKGRDTIANFHSRTGLWDFGLWTDIVERGNCEAVIDEAHMWFSARTWSKNEQLQLSYFQQHRKEGVNLRWIAQHEARVDVAIREVTAFVWRVRKVGQYCVVAKYAMEDKKHRIGMPIVWKINPSYFQHYFTEERIGFRDGEGYRFGAGAAYATQERSGSALLGNCKLAPNRFRLEYADGSVKYMAADHAGLGIEVGRCLASWTAFGAPKRAEAVVRPLYVGPGGVQELDSGGDIVANGVQSNVYQDAREYVHGWLNAMRRGPVLEVIKGEDGRRKWKVGL